MKVFTGNNPSVLYLQAMNELFISGKQVSPRGKLVKELRPVAFEFQDPLNRVTFLRGRKINPFFNLAESFWIISGCSDVEFMDAFNSNLKSFSDDGKYYNAAYGERIRYFTKNDLHNIVLNPIDQLQDAYLKLKNDRDTRQAVIVISNPLFDNFKYIKVEKGLDCACNLVITFKIRDNKLEMTVFNRSNDIIYGIFGANLAQFSTIQELMAGWLGVPVGTYTHITDSLHTYLDSYGCGENEEIMKAHPGLDTNKFDTDNSLEAKDFEFNTEPRMSLSYEKFDTLLSLFWGSLKNNILDDKIITKEHKKLCQIFGLSNLQTVIDPYWSMTFYAMVAYRLIRLHMIQESLEVIKEYIPNSRWKVAMMYFIKQYMRGKPIDTKWTTIYKEIVEDLKNNVKSNSDVLEEYLAL